MFTIEIKRGYSKYTPFDLLDRSDRSAVQTFEGWVAQAIESAGFANSPLWLIVFKRDQRRAMAAFPSNLITRLNKAKLTSTLSLYAVVPQMRLRCSVRMQDSIDLSTDVIIMPFDDFLRALSPKDVRALTEK